jgi:hypothetical protein
VGCGFIGGRQLRQFHFGSIGAGMCKQCQRGVENFRSVSFFTTTWACRFDGAPLTVGSA